MADASFHGGPLDGRVLTLPVDGGHFSPLFTHHGFTGDRGTTYTQYLYHLAAVTEGVAHYFLEESDESVLRTVQSVD